MSETVGGSPGRSGKKLLTLTDLVFFGIVLIQPIAPVPLYGVAQKLSNGYLTTIILFAMFAMMITAVSYGRMAALFPSAGSAYTYVGKGNQSAPRISRRLGDVSRLFAAAADQLRVDCGGDAQRVHAEGAVRGVGGDCGGRDYAFEFAGGSIVGAAESDFVVRHVHRDRIFYRARDAIFVSSARVGAEFSRRNRSTIRRHSTCGSFWERLRLRRSRTSDSTA